MSDGIQIILAVKRMVRALGEAQAVIAEWVDPERKTLAEDAMDRLTAILDNQDLVSIMRTGEIPESIKIQSKTLLKHSQPPEGVSIEVSSAWFKMAQNIAKFCEGLPHIVNLPTPELPYDEGPHSRDERSERI